MQYSVTIMDAGGVRRAILREAGSEGEVVAQLRGEGAVVLRVEVIGDDVGLPPRWHPAWLMPMTGFDAEMGLRQLASMLKSGVTLLAALETVGEQARSPRAHRVWGKVRERVLAGDSLADAMEAQGRRFGDLAVRLARVGEQSGELDLALTRAAEQMEARRNLRALVVNALVYPALALAMTIGVSAFLVMAVIPKISAFLQSNGAELPSMTQNLMDISNWLMANGPWIAGGILMAAVVWLVARGVARGRELEDALLLRLPVAGRILRLSGTAVFARAMQTMITSGVPLLDALAVAARLLANQRLARRVARVHEEVMHGSALAPALASAREFPAMLGRMAAVGEMTGSLAETFGETARFNEMMLAVAIKRFSVLIEPAMIVVTGTIVGYVYIAFFMAIFSLAGAK